MECDNPVVQKEVPETRSQTKDNLTTLSRHVTRRGTTARRFVLAFLYDVFPTHQGVTTTVASRHAKCVFVQVFQVSARLIKLMTCCAEIPTKTTLNCPCVSQLHHFFDSIGTPFLFPSNRKQSVPEPSSLLIFTRQPTYGQCRTENMNRTPPQSILPLLHIILE